MLDQDDLTRYNRQIVMPEFGEEGQERLKASRVVIAGVGGLGCASATYLAAAGAGHLTIIDFDTVELSDLNRQILYTEGDLGEEKVAVAVRQLARLNPGIAIDPVCARIDTGNVQQLIEGATVVVDGLDNAAAREAVNAACVALKIPFVYGGVSRLRGMATTILPGETPCLSCFAPTGVGGQGVLGVLPGIIGNIQALEAIKICTGRRPALAGRLLLFNGEDLKVRVFDIIRNGSCPVCAGPAR